MADTFGEQQSVYSWKLAAADRLLKGKRDCVSLREKEAEIRKDLKDDINALLTLRQTSHHISCATCSVAI
ncbi:integrase DNA-binding domain-containing protein [Beduini massiliensis]|uniref:integrase DNA-binding domain-containing protein n=1 Tax=Beduini massiliensis TaxID=1585974 RepID=UPI00059A9308